MSGNRGWKQIIQITKKIIWIFNKRTVTRIDSKQNNSTNYSIIEVVLMGVSMPIWILTQCVFIFTSAWKRFPAILCFPPLNYSDLIWVQQPQNTVVPSLTFTGSLQSLSLSCLWLFSFYNLCQVNIKGLEMRLMFTLCACVCTCAMWKIVVRPPNSKLMVQR